MIFNQRELITINMTAFGLNTLVSTTQKEIDWYMDDYKGEPDASFANGNGKQALMQIVYKKIFFLDKYFDIDSTARKKKPELWNSFMNDCIVYATLHSYLTGRPLPIVM